MQTNPEEFSNIVVTRSLSSNALFNIIGINEDHQKDTSEVIAILHVDLLFDDAVLVLESEKKRFNIKE